MNAPQRIQRKRTKDWRMPEGAVSPAQTRVLLRLLKVFARDGRATVQTVADDLGMSKANVHRHLCNLHCLGLVVYPSDTRGALRSLVVAV